ncbi:MAG: uroporphyrinogen III synthase HEM4 [Methylomonas sp.]|nr:MAG: uroporphyrinogen III synthase HEM4 [Methylomonas sp.]
MTTQLNGALILVTRPAAQAENLCQLLESAGGKAFRFPTLDIQATALDTNQLQKALNSQWLIFTSTNAVDFALQAFSGKMAELNFLQLAAVGQATANALQQANLTVNCVPATDFSSEGLLAEPAMQQVVGQQITIVRGVGGREKLAQTLTSRGAKVGYLEVYCRSCPETNCMQVVQAIRNNLLQAITITSGEALQNLLSMLDESSAVLLRKLPLVVASERIRHLAHELGFTQIVVSLQPTDAAILETLTTLLSGEYSGRSN